MARQHLPQLDNEVFLTDAGLETWLIFLNNTELRDFSAFELVRSDRGRQALSDYYRPFLNLAERHNRGLIIETPTWRASPDWGARLGYQASDLTEINRESVAFLAELRTASNNGKPVIISGNIGPRGDGYDPGRIMSVGESESFHALQIGAFATTEADMIAAVTLTNVPEAIGIVRAAGKADLPCAIGFTVETDGRLPTGQTLASAIAETDSASSTPPVYYMINCAHPDHFIDELENCGDWAKRIRGIRANASRMSHAELDAAEELDDGNPKELAAQYQQLARLLPNLSVVGGCCGTDHRHIEAIAEQFFSTR